MLYSTYSDKGIQVRTGKWSQEESGPVVESFTVLTLTDSLQPYENQLEVLLQKLHDVVGANGTPVLMRFFVSDPANQTALLRERLVFDCPVSIIGQAPLNGTKIAAMVWCRQSAAICSIGDRMHKVTERGIDEYWFTGGLSDSEGSYNQTVALLDELSKGLESQGLTLETNCMRTWLFVQNIDVNYKGVVDGRNTVFDRHGLTPDTHFIASTGIEGRTANHNNKVMLDAVAVSGHGVLVKYLYGQSHLNRTSQYGVRFERGTVIEYPDRRHVYISGTASIDNKGKILHEGDIVSQTNRMIENVEVLLNEAGCGFSQVGSMIVYLRDSADYAVVNKIFDTRFPDCPRVTVQAPVCRPGWLVEMECIAIY
jgi:enamine deaminase RidA (YjgF/YER057c/UK114 family)